MTRESATRTQERIPPWPGEHHERIRGKTTRKEQRRTSCRVDAESRFVHELRYPNDHFDASLLPVAKVAVVQFRNVRVALRFEGLPVHCSSSW